MSAKAPMRLPLRSRATMRRAMASRPTLPRNAWILGFVSLFMYLSS
jgi:hypothetical protein